MKLLRYNATIRELFGWKKMMSDKAHSRYFAKFNHTTNQQSFTKMYRWFFSRFNFDNFTLDFDSTVITHYRKQGGAVKGYNSAKRDRISHYPLLTFVPNHKLIADAGCVQIRAPMSNFGAFLSDTLEKLDGK